MDKLILKWFIFFAPVACTCDKELSEWELSEGRDIKTKTGHTEFCAVAQFAEASRHRLKTFLKYRVWLPNHGEVWRKKYCPKHRTGCSLGSMKWKVDFTTGYDWGLREHLGCCLFKVKRVEDKTND